MHLVEGIPLRGKVTNETFDYFYLDLIEDTPYEIILTPISGGNPDLVLSYHHKNKFPTLESHDYKSNLSNQSVDSIILEKNSLKRKDGKPVKQVFIGVYSEDN